MYFDIFIKVNTVILYNPTDGRENLSETDIFVEDLGKGGKKSFCATTKDMKDEMVIN